MSSYTATGFKPHIIHNPAKDHQSAKSVADGIIKSAMLTSFQRDSIDGLINSAIPGHKARHESAGAKLHGQEMVGIASEYAGISPKAPKKMGTGKTGLHKASASKTPQDIGRRHFAGSHFA